MTTIELNSNEYSEGVKFPKTRMGEESVVDVTIKNPYETRIHIEAVPKDPDLHVLFCPEYLEGNDSAVIKLDIRKDMNNNEHKSFYKFRDNFSTFKQKQLKINL